MPAPLGDRDSARGYQQGALQAMRRGKEIPKCAAGEDVGVGRPHISPQLKHRVETLVGRRKPLLLRQLRSRLGRDVRSVLPAPDLERHLR